MRHLLGRGRERDLLSQDTLLNTHILSQISITYKNHLRPVKSRFHWQLDLINYISHYIRSGMAQFYLTFGPRNLRGAHRTVTAYSGKVTGILWRRVCHSRTVGVKKIFSTVWSAVKTVKNGCFITVPDSQSRQSFVRSDTT